ncbi:MAG: ABC transporter permease [Bacteroidota bacterium]
MRMPAIIKKALIMQLRDYWALLLTIGAAPFFVFIYYAMTSGGSTTYSVHCFYQNPAKAEFYKDQLVNSLKGVTYSNGKAPLEITVTEDTTYSKQLIRDRKADVLLVIPEGFSDSLHSRTAPEFLVFGEASNPKYSIGLIFTITGIETLVKQYSENKPLYTFSEEFMGNSEAKTEFEVYVPGIFIFSIIMLILSASLIFIRDVEDRTMLRLKISRMTVFDYLLGNTLVQWAVGILSFILTYMLAVMLGFSSHGSVWLVLLVCSVTILSVIAISLILVAFCKNVGMVMILGNFPLFILMFFSGAMLPLPRNEIITGFALNDLLPPTHAVLALTKIFTYGAGFSDIQYELSMLSMLTIIYYITGILLFRKSHLTAA